MTRMEQLITRLEITQEIQITRNRYNTSNTNNIGNMGHSTKEQLTWWFWNTAGVRIYLQLPLTWAHTFFICMIHVKVKMIWIAAERGLVSTPGIFSLFSELKENVLLEGFALRNNTPLDLSQFCLFFVVTEPHWSDICVNENM